MQWAIDTAGSILGRGDARELPEFPGQMCLIGITGGRGDVAQTAARRHAPHCGVEASDPVVMLRIETDRRAK
jgi:hypothetical protein